MPIYVGLDSSTQGLTLVAIEVAGMVRQIAFSHTLNFDAGWPHFGTRYGVLPSDDPLVAVAPPLLWVEALEQMMRLAAREIDLSAVRAIAGVGAAARQRLSRHWRRGRAGAGRCARRPGRAGRTAAVTPGLACLARCERHRRVP